MSAEQPHYLAFMLHLWQAGSEESPIWRASLESPRTRERLAFVSLDALIAYLKERCAPDSPYALPPCDDAPAIPPIASDSTHGTEKTP